MRLKSEGVIPLLQEPPVPPLPMSYADAMKKRAIRKPTNMVCTITNDSGDELTYLGTPISQVIEENYSIGDVISMLWFRRRFPAWATRFLEKVLIISADHGPCVSGAHNAIVASRAARDLMSCVASGILTIGSRFGGALDDAARFFKDALQRKISPREFVAEMKAKDINIPGIGHLVKSVQNPDKRVELLKKFARENFPATDLLNFALEVEKVTTAKRNNLILNVDGCIGILLVDMLRCLEIDDEQIDKIIERGTFNGLFVLARTIGIIGHTIDQKRIDARLYRHPYDDVLFLDDQPGLTFEG